MAMRSLPSFEFAGPAPHPRDNAQPLREDERCCAPPDKANMT